MSNFSRKPVYKKHLYIPTSKLTGSDFTQTMGTMVSENRNHSLEERYANPENKVL